MKGVSCPVNEMRVHWTSEDEKSQLGPTSPEPKRKKEFGGFEKKTLKNNQRSPAAQKSKKEDRASGTKKNKQKQQTTLGPKKGSNPNQKKRKLKNVFINMLFDKQTIITKKRRRS